MPPAQLTVSPNPVTPSTQILYSLPDPGAVRVSLRDIQGRTVRMFVDDTKLAGQHHVYWGSLDTQDNPVSTGVYLVELATGTKVQTVRVLVAK
jgi:hypothetical protein